MDSKIEKADFKAVETMLWKAFGKKKDMVFSTSYENDVTSRWVTPAAIDGKLYFLTSKESRKYPQLVKNPNAALCGEGLYFKVKAQDVGTPKDEKNKHIHEALRAALDDKSQYDMLSAKSCAVFIELDIFSGELFAVEDGHYAVYAADFTKKEAIKLNFF